MYAKVFHVVSLFQQNPAYIFLPPYLLLDHPILHSLIKNTNDILLGVWIMKFLTMKFSQSSRYFILLRRKYRPQHSIFKIHQPVRLY